MNRCETHSISVLGNPAHVGQGAFTPLRRPPGLLTCCHCHTYAWQFDREHQSCTPMNMQQLSGAPDTPTTALSYFSVSGFVQPDLSSPQNPDHSNRLAQLCLFAMCHTSAAAPGAFCLYTLPRTSLDSLGAVLRCRNCSLLPESPRCPDDNPHTTIRPTCYSTCLPAFTLEFVWINI